MRLPIIHLSRLFLVALSPLLLVTPSRAADRPNIILIVADDVGRDWVSCYGAKHQTPNIDRLAKQGVRYETAWSTPVSTPTRVTLLTGQYPFRHGWTRHYDVLQSGGDGLSWTKFTTIGRVLRDAGYATAIGGKWQLDDLGKQPDALKRHGFDEHCVWPGAEAGRPETARRYWNGHVITNGKRETVPYGPDTINSFLIDFVQRRKKNQPFFVYYPMLLATDPLTTTPLNKDDPPQGKEALFAGDVSYVDHLVGRLVKTIDREGLADNTLIIFTADNGSAVAGVLNGQPFETGKGSETDRGVHVPFIVRAPFLTPGNRVSRDMIDFSDLYPTLLDVAKISVPEGTVLDGQSFVPSLSGSEDPFEKRNWIFSQLGDFRMIRDWQHIVDSKGNFHDLTKDPLQQTEVSPLDKIAPGRRQRLEMILKRFPNNAPVPFPELRTKRQAVRQSND